MFTGIVHLGEYLFSCAEVTFYKEISQNSRSSILYKNEVAEG